MPIITLTTDYGARDHYVGAMRGVISSIAPKASITDVTHEIEPHNVLQGAFILWQTFKWYPAGTIHIVVVDPGVGSKRRILAGRYAGQYLIAPDNGLVTLLHRERSPEAMHSAENPRYFLPNRSTTFHGRDIMAPLAAHLANGVSLRAFGPVVDQIEMLPVAHRAEQVGESIRGGVLHVDRFGTLVTNVRQEQLLAPRMRTHAFEVEVNGENIGPVRSTFSDVPVGEPAALVGGSGLLEVAINKGRAVDRFGPAERVSVTVR